MALQRLKRAAAHTAPLTRWLFGVRVPHRVHQGHWDFSTLVIFRELRKRVKPGQRILELGTGEIGTLSIAMARLVPARYLALDIAQEAVESARKVAAANHVTVEFLESDLLAAVPRDLSFDLTFFNPPYLPRAQGDAWRSSGEPARVFDGGDDGLDVIRRFFLEAAPWGTRLGAILIGFNRQAVPESAVAQIARTHGFSQTAMVRAFHPGTVMVLRSG